MRARGYGENLQPREEIVEFERLLQKLGGISQVKVVGLARPARIYVVATAARADEEVIREVQEAGVEELGIMIDERAILVTRMEDGNQRPASSRPILERVITTDMKGAAWIKVVLAWPNGDVTEGVAPVEPAREGRAKGAVAAGIMALEPILSQRSARIYIDHVLVNQVGPKESVMVASVFQENGSGTPVVGSALAHDDLSSAAVRALLHSINRKLEDFGRHLPTGA